MFSPDDTIVALATPPGRGGLSVVRLSGPRSREIASLLIDSPTALEPRQATLVREGIVVAIAGRPNVGKSTLFNRLSGADRAIVTPVPGTTRDLLTEAVMLGATRVTLVDTAGLRPLAQGSTS